MPYVNVRILGGATVAQKKAVVADITHSLVTRLGKHPEHIHIVIDEVSPENWGYAGMLTTEYLAAQNAAAAAAAPASGRKKGAPVCARGRIEISACGGARPRTDAPCAHLIAAA